MDNNIIGYQPKARGETRPPKGGTGESSRVLSFPKKEDQLPHLSGKAKCMQCKHEWVAVCPAGTDWLECPKCHSMKGFMKYHCDRDDSAHWTCNCGNDLFFILPEGTLCPNCGTWQTGF